MSERGVIRAVLQRSERAVSGSAPSASGQGAVHHTMPMKPPVPNPAASGPDGAVARPAPEARGFGLRDPAAAWTMLEASSDCVTLIEPDGTFRYVNTAGYELMEFDEAVMGSRWSELWPDDGHQAVEGALDEARQGQPSRFTGLCPTRKGTPKWWDVVVNPVRTESGDLDCFLCIWRDITAWKQAEEALTQSEQRFRALADTIAQFAWMAYPSGYIFWHNQRWLDYTGVDAKDATGNGWQKAIHPDYVDRVGRQLEQALQKGETWQETYPLRGADGEYRWFLSRAMPLRDGHGRVALWCGTDTDITDQRRASQRLFKQQRVIELSHEALMVWDLDEGIILFNRGCENLYGFKKSEALGLVSAELLRTQYPMSREAMLAHLATEGAWTGEVLQLAKDGSEIWVDTRLELVRTGGRRLVFETNRDITERRKADEIRNLLVGELNHRVKNTLAIVQSIASQTARTTSTIDQFIGRFNGRIQSLSSAHHMLTEAHWSGASLRELITSQIAVSAGEARNITISGPDVFVPPQTALQMTLMLHELATNAIKHGSLSRPAGRVNISWTSSLGAEPHINLTWIERGGPPVTPPVARGFGTLLLERSGKLPHLKAWLEFDPEGVVCRIEAAIIAAREDQPPYFNPGARPRRVAE
jgi:PAS domain S-box-containing protein